MVIKQGDKVILDPDNSGAGYLASKVRPIKMGDQVIVLENGKVLVRGGIKVGDRVKLYDMGDGSLPIAVKDSDLSTYKGWVLNEWQYYARWTADYSPYRTEFLQNFSPAPVDERRIPPLHSSYMPVDDGAPATAFGYHFGKSTYDLQHYWQFYGVAHRRFKTLESVKCQVWGYGEYPYNMPDHILDCVKDCIVALDVCHFSEGDDLTNAYIRHLNGTDDMTGVWLGVKKSFNGQLSNTYPWSSTVELTFDPPLQYVDLSFVFLTDVGISHTRPIDAYCGIADLEWTGESFVGNGDKFPGWGDDTVNGSWTWGGGLVIDETKPPTSQYGVITDTWDAPYHGGWPNYGWIKPQPTTSGWTYKWSAGEDDCSAFDVWVVNYNSDARVQVCMVRENVPPWATNDKVTLQIADLEKGVWKRIRCQLPAAMRDFGVGLCWMGPLSGGTDLTYIGMSDLWRDCPFHLWATT